MLTGFFLILLVAFTILAGWLSWKNNFSPEVESILFKAIGAVAVAIYFMVSTFLVNPKKELGFEVSVPLMYEPSLGVIFSPYVRNAQSLPEESNMFKGLAEYNSKRLYDCLKEMEFWKKLKLSGEIPVDVNAADRLEYLEFIFLDWMEQEANWLKVFETITYTHRGYGSGASFLHAGPSVSNIIKLEALNHPNPFFVACPRSITLPKGAIFKRELQHGMILLTITTDTGVLNINFLRNSGGVFDQNLPTKLVNNLAQLAKVHLGTSLPQRLWVDYPLIQVKYSAYKTSQFSDQTKSEMDWLKKIGNLLYRDFSWDLLREYLAFDYKSALDLYRNGVAKNEDSKL